MIETELNIKTDDGKIIYGRLFQASARPASRIIVFVHRLPGGFCDYPNFSAAQEFVKRGYDCLIYSQYDWRDSARRLKDCTLALFGKDIDFILAKKTTRYKKVFLIGHSYGGPSILHTKSDRITAVSLWDPTYNIASLWAGWAVKRGKLLIDTGAAYEMVIPSRLYKEAMKFDREKCRTLSRNFKKPLQVTQAGQSILYELKESYHSFHQGLNDYHVIKKADHSFTTQKTLHAAIDKADQWFNSF